MTKSTSAVLALAALLYGVMPATSSAQAAPAKDKEQKHAMEMGDHHGSSAWKELDAFHTLLAATWHPAAKSNDLKPIREKATALSDAAQAWAASKVPAACDNKPLRDAIAKVASDSKELATLVYKQAPNPILKRNLKALHDQFEVVEEGCKP